MMMLTAVALTSILFLLICVLPYSFKVTSRCKAFFNSTPSQGTVLLHSTSRSGDGFAGQSKEPTVDRRTYSWKDGSPNNYRNTNSNNDNKDKDRDSARNTWKSGYVLVNDRGNSRGNRRLRNDPWWMQEEEKNNPRMLPEYNPTWKTNSGSDFEDSSVLKEVLVNEAKLRGLATSGKKIELLQRLREYSSRHSLSDDNFRAPQYSATTVTSTLPPCYPEVYEGFLGIQELREKISQMAAPISNNAK